MLIDINASGWDWKSYKHPKQADRYIFQRYFPYIIVPTTFFIRVFETLPWDIIWKTLWGKYLVRLLYTSSGPYLIHSLGRLFDTYSQESIWYSPSGDYLIHTLRILFDELPWERISYMKCSLRGNYFIHCLGRFFDTIPWYRFWYITSGGNLQYIVLILL